MPNSSIDIVHFHNGSGGGVLSVISNLLRYSQNQEIRNHVIFTINKEFSPNYRPPFLKNAFSVKVFYFSPEWNFYYTCRQLASLLPHQHAVLVAHDWLELGMIANLGLQNPVVNILHGDYDYYYDLAFKHQQWIDGFIAVSKSIAANLIERIPEYKGTINHLPIPVPENEYIKLKTQFPSVIFIGRASKEKGYPILSVIAEKLFEKHIELEWHIVGTMQRFDTDSPKWNDKIKVRFYGDIKNTDVIKLISQMHFFILPSLAEGTPVALVEAMKAGAIPLVNDIPGGIQELVINGKTGFRIQANNEDLFVKQFEFLLRQKDLAERIREECMTVANDLFDPHKNTLAFESFFQWIVRNNKKSKLRHKVYGSRLDQPWLPNFITSFLRN